MVSSLAALVSRVASTPRRSPAVEVVAPPRRATDAVVVSQSLAAAQTGGVVPQRDGNTWGEEPTAELAYGDPAVGRRLNRVA